MSSEMDIGNKTFEFEWLIQHLSLHKQNWSGETLSPRKPKVGSPAGMELGDLTKTQRQERSTKPVKSNYTEEREVWAASTTA